MLRVGSWRWPQWIFLLGGLLFLAVYFGFVSLGGVEQRLEQLAVPREAAGGLFQQGTGRGDALFIVFAFLLLTPVALVVIAGLPMFVSAVLAGFFRAMLRIPEEVTTLGLWVALAVVAWVRREAWVGHVEWFVGLLARAILIALETS